jgi:DNA adenine methylase
VTNGTRQVFAAARYRSPLRYPGGKGTLAPFFQRLMWENDLVDGHYAEAYAGGAGLALALLYTEYASHIHINDLDRSIYAFWHSVLNNTEELCHLIRSTPLTVPEWRRQRAVQALKADVPLLQLGFSTFYLNRTNRSGIIGSGGVIGGLRQTGAWCIDARFNRADLVRRVERVAAYRDRISLYNLDAVDFLALTAGTLPERTLAYLDPPYFVKGQRKLYARYYREQDHAEIAQLLDAYPWPWVVAYDDAPEILRLYRRSRRTRYGIDYSASGRSVGAEVMFFSPHLGIPNEIRSRA